MGETKIKTILLVAIMLFSFTLVSADNGTTIQYSSPELSIDVDDFTIEINEEVDIDFVVISLDEEITEIKINFGGGETKTLSYSGTGSFYFNEEYSYEEVGEYEISLIVETSNGSYEEYSNEIEVEEEEIDAPRETA